jgi:hypothetical protein
MASLTAQGKDLPLDEIQAQLVGQSAVISGPTTTSGNRESLLTNWYYVVREGVAGFKKSSVATATPPFFVCRPPGDSPVGTGK